MGERMETGKQVWHYFLKSVWSMYHRQIQFLSKHRHTRTFIYIPTHISIQMQRITQQWPTAALAHKSEKEKGEAPHTWTYWGWPQLQLPGAAGLICWQGPQRLRCGLRHWESACAQHVGSWGMTEEWEIRVSAPGRQEVGLFEPLAVVLLGLEFARKKKRQVFQKEGKGKTNRQA